MKIQHQNKTHYKRKEAPHQIKERNQRINRNNIQDIPEISLELLLRKLFAGFLKLFIALKYQFHRLTAGHFQQTRIPWLKISLALIAFFLLTKKDIQFSVNMKAPLAKVGLDDREDNQLGLLQTTSIRPKPKSMLPAIEELDEQKVAAYIRRFSRVAVTEMEKYGIPASVKLAQGILESWHGDHLEATQSNNHFGRITSGDHYNSAWENWRAHSMIMKENYPDLFEFEPEPEIWTQNIQKVGYSTEPDYAEKLMHIIKKYQLTQLDDI
jgi:flagellum-specific peptidoglycan hydrolase FlgJ